MLIDTHAHLDFEIFDADLPAVLERARAAGVEKIINITAYAKDFDKVKQVAEAHNNIWHTAGIEPHDTAQLKVPDWLRKIRALAQGTKIVAIGEIGLDYFKMQNTKEEQLELLLPQLGLAQELGSPVILHARDAYQEVYDIVKSRRLKAVVHCFRGTAEWAQKFLDLGYLLSFTGLITFPKTESIADAIKNVPLERIMVETDSPFLAPQRVRGQRCEPAYVKDVAEKIAEIKGISFDEVAQVTTDNAEKFFGLV